MVFATLLAALVHAQEACFCLVRADDTAGPILRDCNAFKDPDDAYVTAVCTDPDGKVRRQLVTDAWQRLSQGEGRCVPCRRSESAEDRGVSSLVAQAVDSLRKANIAFNAPTTITVGRAQNIQLLLHLDRSIDELLHQITDEGKSRGRKIRVSDRMEAVLKGADFAVTAITPIEQSVLAGESTEWRWQVTSEKAGRHDLFLTLKTFVEVGGVEKSKRIETFKLTIEVQVRPFADRAADFVAEHWQWLWTALVPPLAWYVARIRRRSRRESKESTKDHKIQVNCVRRLNQVARHLFSDRVYQLATVLLLGLALAAVGWFGWLNHRLPMTFVKTGPAAQQAEPFRVCKVGDEIQYPLALTKHGPRNSMPPNETLGWWVRLGRNDSLDGWLARHVGFGGYYVAHVLVTEHSLPMVDIAKGKEDNIPKRVLPGEVLTWSWLLAEGSEFHALVVLAKRRAFDLMALRKAARALYERETKRTAQSGGAIVKAVAEDLTTLEPGSLKFIFETDEKQQPCAIR